LPCGTLCPLQEDRWKTGVGSTTTRFAYDGDNQWADLNGSNAVLTRYVYEDGVDQVLARIVASGTHTGVAYYLTDNLGSVRDVADGSMVVQYHADYDGFGNVTEVNPGWGDRLKFTAREYDSDTGLQYNRARWYDARIGRWLSQDPSGLDAEDANLYRYVRNAPVFTADPSGLMGVFFLGRGERSTGMQMPLMCPGEATSFLERPGKKRCGNHGP
jgi:RHS repeat-associated protein